MINFEEELKKFHPSMEVDEVEDAVFDHDLTDMTDIMLSMMKQAKDAGQSAQPPQPPQQPLQGTTVI
ncbi:MAG: hypothetical protein IKR47_04990 [Lachnospiraceae bacterium]|nr:hypothetical protein [Lachnospiraceae bacterium]MCR4685682.1 hypothetical protein [Lachnospiraceae bacterium]